jgi:hypothetical protein
MGGSGESLGSPCGEEAVEPPSYRQALEIPGPNSPYRRPTRVVVAELSD